MYFLVELSCANDIIERTRTYFSLLAQKRNKRAAAVKVKILTDYKITNYFIISWYLEIKQVCCQFKFVEVRNIADTTLFYFTSYVHWILNIFIARKLKRGDDFQKSEIMKHISARAGRPSRYFNLYKCSKINLILISAFLKANWCAVICLSFLLRSHDKQRFVLI